MTPETRVRPAPHTAYQLLDGLAVVVATRRRTVHRLDEVATDLWRFLEPGRTVAETVAFLLESYDVDEATARRDVVDFLAELSEKGLVEVTP